MWKKTTILPVAILFVAIQVTTCLRCYTCENEESNTMCVGEHTMVECAQGLDTCQTIVDFSEATETMSIIKTCTKNSSCFRQKLEHVEIQCDTYNPRWLCIDCCHDDGCNVNTASSPWTVGHALTIMAACLLAAKILPIIPVIWIS